MIEHLWRAVRQHLSKPHIHSPCEPAISLLGPFLCTDVSFPVCAACIVYKALYYKIVGNGIFGINPRVHLKGIFLKQKLFFSVSTE